MANNVTLDDMKSLPIGEFETTPHYDSDSDTLSIFIDDAPSFRERIDQRLTVYRSMESKKVVGCHIKHVSSILKTIHAFHLDIESRGVTIGLLLLGLPISGDEEPHIQSSRYVEVVRPITEKAGCTAIPELSST